MKESFLKRVKRVELPSQNEVENWPIPDEPLSWEFLQQLHEPEEVKSLIKERHGLNSEDLFKKIPNAGCGRTKFDEYYLLKLALFRLECIKAGRIASYFDYECKDHRYTSNDKDYRTILPVICYLYFSDLLKLKISLNRISKKTIPRYGIIAK